MLPPAPTSASRAARTRLRARVALSAAAALALAAVLALPTALPAAASEESAPGAEQATVDPARPERSRPSPTGAPAPTADPSPAPTSEPTTGNTDGPTDGPTGGPTDGTDGPTPGAPAGEEPTGPAPAAPVVAAGPRCPGGAWGATPTSGALDPVGGQRYGGSLLAPDVLDLRLLDDTGTPAAPVARVALPGARAAGDGSDGGGLALDAAGHLYVVAAPAPAPGRSTTARLYRTVTPVGAPGDAGLTAVPVSATRVDRPVVRIGFDSEGLLHLVHVDGSTRVDPVTGRVVDRLTPGQGQALACGRASHVDLRLVARRGVDAPDARPVLLGPDRPAGAAGGAAGGVVLPGGTYALRVTDPAAAGGSVDVRWTCRDQADRRVPTDAGAYAPPDRAFGSVVTCTAVLRPRPDRGAPARPAARRAGDLLTATGPTARTERAAARRDPGTGGLGGGFPGLGMSGGIGRGDDTDPTDTADQTSGTAARPPAGLGLGSFGTTGAQQRPRAAAPRRGARAGSTAEDDGPLDPVLPDTGGPSAVALPVGLGAIVAGAVLLTRRRRPTGSP